MKSTAIAILLFALWSAPATASRCARLRRTKEKTSLPASMTYVDAHTFEGTATLCLRSTITTKEAPRLRLLSSSVPTARPPYTKLGFILIPDTL